ncbi:Uncharacterised protein [Streptococcus infantis]|uniref:hypothetical protein n=1 Tax=Streptococcus infantis TaxID=68892 RepID=UPI000E08A4DF|nr:hypothetical protein [Streptococcus infantis]SUN81270.1 Uncharacterised protein [Streptococcus infantis]
MNPKNWRRHSFNSYPIELFITTLVPGADSASFVATTAIAEDLEVLDKSNDIEGWIDLVNQYLEHCKKSGLSAPNPVNL